MKKKKSSNCTKSLASGKLFKGLFDHELGEITVKSCKLEKNMDKKLSKNGKICFYQLSLDIL